MTWWRRLSSVALLGIVANCPAHAGPADADSVLLLGGAGPVSVCESPAMCDLSRGLSVATAEEVTPDYSPGYSDDFGSPPVFPRVTETEPMIVTADLESADVAYLLGARAVATLEPSDDADVFLTSAASRAEAMTAMVITAGLFGVGWVRYRLYQQRRRWRRSAAKRRAKRKAGYAP